MISASKAMAAQAKFVKSPPSGRTQLLKTLNMTSLHSNGGQIRITWSNPSEQYLKWLARGIVNISLSVMAAGETVELSGRIGIKRTCNSKSRD